MHKIDQYIQSKSVDREQAEMTAMRVSDLIKEKLGWATIAAKFDFYAMEHFSIVKTHRFFVAFGWVTLLEISDYKNGACASWCENAGTGTVNAPTPSIQDAFFADLEMELIV